MKTHNILLRLTKFTGKFLFLPVVKWILQVKFSKNSVGLKLTLNGNINEHKSALKVEVYAEDKDMTPHIISEFENAVSPQNCPECEEDLPAELVKKLMEGVPSIVRLAGLICWTLLEI